MKTAKQWAILLSIFSAVCILSYCGNRSVSFDKHRKKLLEMHEEQQKAHMGKNAKLFVDQFAPDMISVNRGKISSIGKDSALRRFESYFSNVTFRKWEDVNPPVIHFSNDASMAYMVVDKQIITEYAGENNIPSLDTARFAWVSILKRENKDDWKVVCNVSTNQ